MATYLISQEFAEHFLHIQRLWNIKTERTFSAFQGLTLIERWIYWVVETKVLKGSLWASWQTHDTLGQI